MIKSYISNPRILLSALIYAGAVCFFLMWKPPEFKGCRGHRPDAPEFNGYLLSYEDARCHDLPLIDARLLTDTGRNGRYSRTASEHEEGITAEPDRVIRIAIWFHNSGSEEKRSLTTARNVRIGSILDNQSGVTHTVGAVISADNAETIRSADHGGDAVVRTVKPSVLEYVPNTTEICLQGEDILERGLAIAETCGNYPEGTTRYRLKIPDGVANASVKIGDVKAGDKYSGYIMFVLRAVPQEVAK